MAPENHEPFAVRRNLERQYFQEKIWHGSQKLTAQEDGSVIFEAEVAGTREIKYWILGWGAQAEILEPADSDEYRRKHR